MNDNLRDSLATLATFEAGQWADWILQFVNDAAEAPFISRGVDPPHLALNAIFDQLPPKAKLNFSTGLGHLFPQVRPDVGDARQSLSLLKILDHVSPWEAQPAMFSRLTSGCLRGIRYGGWDLHSLLLVACCHFGIDQRLEDYIFRSVASLGDFDYSVVAFRMLLRLGDARPFLLIEHILPELYSSVHSERFAEILIEALEDRTGSWPLLHWFQEIAPRLEAQNVKGLERFQELVRHVVPWNSESSNADPGLLLLAGWVHAPIRYFKAQDLISLAHTLHRLEKVERREMLRLVLRRICDFGVPWDCIDGRDKEDPWNRLAIADCVRVITYDRDSDQQDEADVPRFAFREEFTLLRHVVSRSDGYSSAVGQTITKRRRRAGAEALAAKAM